MKRFKETLFKVWQEACRHIEIGESTMTIADMLAEQMPVAQLLIRRFDVGKQMLETVAVGFPKGPYAGAEARSLCPEPALRRVSAWCKRREILYRRAGKKNTGFVEALIPAGVTENVLVGPLVNGKALTGVVLAIGRPQQTFSETHLLMMDALLEPFVSALENDLRLREIALLHEAAEADRQSLLMRLGRKDLGDVIVGLESGLKTVMERVELVARSDMPVLILGETGTGKELVARAIHRRSSRATGPIIRVNCGAISPELIDSQLFGHTRGAFTGAVENHAGWFERADGGTLFLDEIGELPLAAQVRLLRILQDGWMERVGGCEPVYVNVRVVAATHKDLATMVTQGLFREDLFYRIAVFPLLLPPLRDRIQDIPVLARHFAERAAIRYGLPIHMPTDRDIEILASYSWPGNVRELGTVMDRAAILGDGKRLEVGKALGVLSNGPAMTRSTAGDGNHKRFLSLDELVRQHIVLALEICHGKVEGQDSASALLKINPHTLRARMRKMKIFWADYRVNE